MASQDPSTETPFPEAAREKYLRERDKRLVPGRAAIRDLRTDEHFRRYRDDPFTVFEHRDALDADVDVDVAIIGAGMAGIVAGAKLREAGIDGIRLLDEAGGVGGTWYWNRYPGIMCDVESYTYLPLLEETGYTPKTRYAFGDEIREHFERIADQYDLVADALFHTRVEQSAWDDDISRWVIETDRGDTIRARYVVMAVGILNLMKLPAIDGMETFAGASFHTARWDFGYTGGTPDGELDELGDKVVGIVGTGASAIQCIPHLAAGAKELHVFQRTPSAVGVRDNRPTPPDFAEGLAPGWQLDRMENFQALMLGRPVEEDLVDDGWTHHFAPTHAFPRDPAWSGLEYMQHLEAFDYAVMEEHRSRVDALVENRDTAEKLKPYYRYICRRPCFHDEYLQTFNRPNVHLIDAPAGIDRVTERGIVVEGNEIELDCIVYATGFEAEATPLSRRVGHTVIGRDGTTLGDKWERGGGTLFGMFTRNFPNMFLMPAPGQQAVVTVNHTLITVVGGAFIGAAVRQLEAGGVRRFEVSEAAEKEWCDTILSTHVDGSSVMAACTPSRVNNEGDPGAANPLGGSYGGGLGDYFGFKQLLSDWLADGRLEGLDVVHDDARPG